MAATLLGIACGGVLVEPAPEPRSRWLATILIGVAIDDCAGCVAKRAAE